MKILINDVLQGKDLDEKLLSPALSDAYTALSSFSIVFELEDGIIDCIGVGYTDATQITFNGEVITLATTEKNGLYDLTTGGLIESDFYLLTEASEELLTESGENILVESVTINVSHNGTYLGRFAAGKSRSIGISPSREPGFYTTEKPRVTASLQVVESAGGASGRRIDVDYRYKIDADIFQDFEDAYQGQISKGFPFFLYFDKEVNWITWTRMYAQDIKNVLFQSSVNRILYSRRASFLERF